MYPSIKRFQPIKLRRTSAAAVALTVIVAIVTGCGGQPKWSSDEAQAIAALKNIARGQAFFQKACFLDVDGDGIGDYGTLDMLADPDGERGLPPLMDLIYTTERVGKYELYLTVFPGESKHSPPRWEGQAFTSEKGLQCFYVDNTGIVRFADRRETANRTSPPVEEQTADA